MRCNYCLQSSANQHQHYNIQNVKERFIPTYSHSLIFPPEAADTINIRCTPTFHSTALETQGYQPTVNQHLHSSNLAHNSSKSFYRNVSADRKQRDLNPGSNFCYTKTGISWYDPAKQQAFDSLAHCCVGSSRERKLIDLSSNPVFGGGYVIPYQINSIHPSKHQPHKKEKEVVEQAKEPSNHSEKDSLDEKFPVQPKQAEQIPPQKQEQPKLHNKGEQKSENASPTIQPNAPIKPAVQQKQQKFSLKKEITLGKASKPGKKMNKTVVIDTGKPTFTVIRKKMF